MAATSDFESMAAHYGFTAAQKAAAWAELGALRIGPNDPEVSRVVLHHVALADGALLQRTAKDIRENLLVDIANVTKGVTANLNETAAAQVKAAVASVRASQAKASAELASGIAEAADRALSRKVAVWDRNSIAGIVLTSLVIAGCVGVVGYRAGQADTQEVAAELAPIAKRGDGPAWVRLMTDNDIAGSMARYCRAGSVNISVVDGGKVCNVPLWLDRSAMAPTANGAGLELRKVPGAVSDWLSGWSPFLVLLAGFLLATLGRKAARNVRAWPPVAWMLDLHEPESPGHVPVRMN